MDILTEHRDGEITVFTNNSTPEIHLTTRRAEAKEEVAENMGAVTTVADNMEDVKGAAKYAQTFDDVLLNLPAIIKAMPAAETAVQAKDDAISAKESAQESAEKAESAVVRAEEVTAEQVELAKGYAEQAKTEVSKVSSAFKIVGTVTTVEDLPKNAEVGNIYLVGDNSITNKPEYVWTSGGTWEKFGETVDLSAYQTKEEAETALADKQDKLTAGEGIKIEGNVISTEGGKLPDNVYTQTNLLGGKDIEIVPEPVEGGIDENTVAVWHFDSKNTDEVQGLALENIGIYGNDPYDTSRMKFGTACTYDFYSSSLKKNDISSLNITDTDFTLDFWFYQTNYQSSGSGKYGLETGSKNLLAFKIYRYEIRLEGDMWGSAKETNVATSTQNTWTHAALQYDHLNKKGYLFINGQKVYEGEVTGVTGQTFKNLYLGHASGPSLLIDELRISNVLRWTEDFTPPTKAYEVPKPTGNMVVNFVGESLQKGADYVVESYNDGANWYRVYKSGWVEQGGSANTSANITLLKPMKDTNYTVIGVQNGTTNPSTQEGSPRAGVISSTQVFVVGGASWQSVNYYVCGQGA